MEKNLIDSIDTRKQEIARLQAELDEKNYDLVCPKCQKKISANAAFCPACGEKLADVECDGNCDSCECCDAE